MLLATVTLWAFNFTVSKYILDHGLHPLTYSSVRYACAAVIFAGITLAWEGSLRVGRRHLPLIGFGTAVLFANQLCFVYALRFTTATTVALLFGTLPIFTALFARGSGVEHLPRRFWVAAGVSFAGVALVALGSGGNLSANRKGDTLALLVAGSRQLADQSFHFGALVWIGFAFAVIGPLVITNLLWFTAIDRVGPSRASLFANLQPFLAALIALVLLSEEITTVQIVGGVAIGAGIVLASRRGPAP